MLFAGVYPLDPD